MKHASNEELRTLIAQHDLTRDQAAALCMCKRSTLDRYLTPPLIGRSRNPTFRPMPDHRLQLLKLGLGNREFSKWKKSTIKKMLRAPDESC